MNLTPRMTAWGPIPAVTAPQYCRPVLLTQQTLRPCSARAGQTARHAIDRTPSRRLRRVANRETQAGYRAQVGLSPVGFSVTYVRAKTCKGAQLPRHATEEVFIPVKALPRLQEPLRR